MRAAGITYDFTIRAWRNIRAQDIQRVFRGYSSRRKFYRDAIEAVMKCRARVCLQRWYRWYASIGRRFLLLQLIQEIQLSIKRPSFYIDPVIFYLIQKKSCYSTLSCFTMRYPEFAGVPCVDPAPLRNSFSPLQSHLAECVEFKNSNAESIATSRYVKTVKFSKSRHYRFGPPR